MLTKPEWNKFYYHSPQRNGQVKLENETFEEETKKVEECLQILIDNGFIKNRSYNIDKFKEFRELVHENFFIYWTAINPPMEHLLYALSDILRPKDILGVGIFTGNPCVWSMGPVINKSYGLGETQLAAVEINKKHAEICDDNFKKIAGKNFVKVHAADGFKILKSYPDNSIDLLYLDANGKDPEAKGYFNKKKNTKRINYTLLKAAYPKIKNGGFAMCHNAYDRGFSKVAGDYLKFTANEEYFEKTTTIGIDEMGLEFSIKK